MEGGPESRVRSWLILGIAITDSWYGSCFLFLWWNEFFLTNPSLFSQIVWWSCSIGLAYYSMFIFSFFKVVNQKNTFCVPKNSCHFLSGPRNCFCSLRKRFIFCSSLVRLLFSLWRIVMYPRFVYCYKSEHEICRIALKQLQTLLECGKLLFWGKQVQHPSRR